MFAPSKGGTVVQVKPPSPPRAARRRPKPPAVHAAPLLPASLSLDAAVDHYLAHLRVARNLTASSLESYGQALGEFAQRLAKRRRRVPAAAEVSPDDILGYLADLSARVSARTQAKRLSVIRGLFGFLGEMELRPDDPTEDLAAPKFGRKLPPILTVKEVARVLAQPDRRTPRGERDAAMLELLYASGLRISELVNLRLGDLELQAGFLKVLGKGRKERLVPFHEQARSTLRRYIENGREEILARGPKSRKERRGRRPVALFVSRLGKALSRDAGWRIVTAAARAAGIRKPLSPHKLRHAFATHLTDNGMELRHVQELLGHTDIGTTSVYTHVSKTRVKEVHRKYHPRG
jgi:integrase/recombinase XerD